ncbi:hypothetical protein F5146DRAFT_927153, partial [Armillaria mellea]
LILLSTCTTPALGETARALVDMYIATAGFGHDSVPTAVQALQARGSAVHLDFQNTEDKGVFTDQGLEGYDVAIFLSTTGELLGDTGKKTASQNNLHNGGKFVGIHSASDSLNATAFYGKELFYLVLFESKLDVYEDASHPSTENPPTGWPVREEIGSKCGCVTQYVKNMVDVYLVVDGGTRRFKPHSIGKISTKNTVHTASVVSGAAARRSFYTSLGHLNERWEVCIPR